MNPNKDTAMLCDVQYVKPRKGKNDKDYLYIIWKDLDTNEKYLKVVEEPKVDIYFEKPELRTHRYNKNYERIENLDKKTVAYKDIIYAIADDIGDSARNLISDAFKTRNFQELNKLLVYPYVFGADYDCVSWYRIQWLMKMHNSRPKKIQKGFLDIEVDGLEVPGMPSPIDCPINAVTIIDAYTKTSYTFLLMFRPFVAKNTMGMSASQIKKEENRKAMYEYMHKQQQDLMDHEDELKKELHELYDESYGDIDYKFYYYTDERKMLHHIFQLINKLKLDFIAIWNMSFDIPYIMERMEALHMNPEDVMCHPDFPAKVCRFKKDNINFEIKKKSDNLLLSSYTVFYDQMELYASIRKGASELRSYKLNYIAERELRDTKLDYSEDGDIKTLPYTNFKKFVIYNIKDVLLQYGIENRTTDLDTLYVSSYSNATSYDKVTRPTVQLRNNQYLSFLKQGLIPGENINIYNQDSNKVESEDEDDDDPDYEGALVADPIYNGYVGVEIYGQPTNNVFADAVDFDMSAFYPNSIGAMNIDASNLIFKVIMPMEQFDLFGGEMSFKGITGNGFAREDDGAKECIDNFQTSNYMSMAHKWLGLPSIDEIYNRLNNGVK